MSTSPAVSAPAFQPVAPGRRHALQSLALAALGLNLSACAQAGEMQGGAGASPVQIEVVDRDSGTTLAVYRHRGRAYVAGAPGTRYALRLFNRSSQRVLVVLAVDGVNVISGETAGWQQTGYVLEPWRTHDITGWRKSDTAVAAFEFAALRDSYAAQTGRPANVGVIGAAVFLEKPVPPPPPIAPPAALRVEPTDANGSPSAPSAAAAPMRRAESGLAAQAAAADNAMKAAPALRQRLGTGHGAQEWSESRRTAFERASRMPVALLEISYDSFDNLVAAGVIAAPQVAQPRAFPQSPPPPWPGFVPDPPQR